MIASGKAPAQRRQEVILVTVTPCYGLARQQATATAHWRVRALVSRSRPRHRRSVRRTNHTSDAKCAGKPPRVGTAEPITPAHSPNERRLLTSATKFVARAEVHTSDYYGPSRAASTRVLSRAGSRTGGAPGSTRGPATIMSWRPVNHHTIALSAIMVFTSINCHRASCTLRARSGETQRASRELSKSVPYKACRRAPLAHGKLHKLGTMHPLSASGLKVTRRAATRSQPPHTRISAFERHTLLLRLQPPPATIAQSCAKRVTLGVPAYLQTSRA